MATKKSAKNEDQVLNAIVEIHKASQKMKLPVASKSKAIAKGVDVCQTYLKIRPFLEIEPCAVPMPEGNDQPASLYIRW